MQLLFSSREYLKQREKLHVFCLEKNLEKYRVEVSIDDSLLNFLVKTGNLQNKFKAVFLKS